MEFENQTDCNQSVWPSKSACVEQMQQQLESQQAQHAVQLQGATNRADQLDSLLQQATDLDQQHLAQLSACESDLSEARQVSLAAITADKQNPAQVSCCLHERFALHWY